MHIKNIFLTGATGVLGAHVLKELLETTDSNISCLVRANTFSLGVERILSCLKAYDPNLLLNDAFRERVQPILGDVSSPQMGLSDKIYGELTESTDVTIHVAALTNLFLNYRRIAPINVGGTENCINFALGTKQKYLSYISTYTVMGHRTFDSTLVFKETDLDVGQNFEYMTYQKSKFTAEKMVREATKLGLKWNIFRPGQIFGESKTGRYPMGQTNVSGLFYDIFKTVLDTNVALKSKSYFDVVPVDYVSRGIVTLGLGEKNLYETFHLTNPDALHFTEVISLLEDQGYDIDYVPHDQYKKMLFENGFRCNGAEYKSSTLSAFKWWFKKDQFTFENSCITDCSYTAAKLAALGVKCPRLDSNLIGIYTDESIRTGYFPKPKLGKGLRGGEITELKELSI